MYYKGPSMTFKVQSRTDVIDTYLDVFPCRRLASQNIIHHLASRQTSIDCPAQAYRRQRSLYQCIVPNHTESNVQVPPGYLRKFSPNGRHLVAFSSDQKSVLIYEYLGAGAANDLYSRDITKEQLKMMLFDQFFKSKYFISVSDIHENLNRECSLFTEDCQYIIVGSSVYIQDDPYPSFYEIFRGNEDISPQGQFRPEDYTLHIVDMLGGFVTDSHQFKCDKIHLAHNQGLSLCGSKLAVLSVQHQTIHLFEISSDGNFIPLHQVGRFCYPDDRVIYDLAESDISGNYREGTGEAMHHPSHEKWFNSLKQRLLCWLLRRAEVLSTFTNETHLVQYFQRFDDVAALRMWKMQLLSNHQVLIKYAKEETVTNKVSDPLSQPALIVIYNLETTEIEAVYENTSEELLRIFERHADSFRVPVSHSLSYDISSVSNSIHACSLHMKFKDTITNAKFGGRREAVKRLLGQLPISCQCYSSSPYLDLALFSYDDKWVSAVERPKPCGDSPVKFFTRNGGFLSFTLDTSLPVNTLQYSLPPARRLVAYIFHPFEPFVISIQKTSTTDYVVCFHIRNTIS